MFVFPLKEPRVAPTGLNATTIKATYLVMSWTRLPILDRNGVITRYTVYYSQSKDKPPKSINSSSLSANITGLSPFTDYIMNVSASTYVGEGPISSEVTVKTAEASKFSVIQFAHMSLYSYPLLITSK